MPNEERTLMVLKLVLEAVKLVISMTEEATDDKIIKARQDIKEAVEKWNN
jgi:hypothetical protein